MTGPVANYMRNLTFPPVMQTWVIDYTLANSRSIQIMKGSGQRWHRASVFGHGTCISIRCLRVGRDAVRPLAALDTVGVGAGVVVRLRG
jgi:hypothetical protein